MARKAAKTQPSKKTQPKKDKSTAVVVPAKKVGGIILPPSKSVESALATERPVSNDPPVCPVCGGVMWDNRATKRNPKAPDFKCRDVRCDGVIWPRRRGDFTQRTQEALQQGKVDASDGHTWRDPKRWKTLREERGRVGMNWLVVVSTDKSCAFAFCSQRDRHGNETVQHWGIAWKGCDTEQFKGKMGERFVHLTKGDKHGCYCRVHQRHDCIGATTAREALLGKSVQTQLELS